MNKDSRRMIVFANQFTSEKVISGGEKHFFEAVKKMQEVFSKVTIVTPRLGYIHCARKGIACEFKVLPLAFLDRLGIVPSYFFRAFLTFFKMPFLKKRLVIYGVSQFIPDVLPAFFCKLFNPGSKWVNCLFHLIPHHSQRKGNKFKNFLAGFEQKLSLPLMRRWCDKVLVDNAKLKRELSSMGFDSHKIDVISMGVDLEKIENMEPSGNHALEAVFLARLHPTKGVFDLPLIWKKVVQKVPHARLGLIGGGSPEMIEKLRHAFAEQGLSGQVEIFGFLDENLMYSVLKAGKIFVFPSHEEGWGIAVAEAMMCNLAVIAWHLPVYDEIFQDKIIKIKENDFNSFSDAVSGLLLNPGQCDKIREEGKKYILRYDWKQVTARELESILSA